MIPPCLALNNIRYVSRVKWSNPGKGVAPSPTPWCSSYWKGSLLVALNYGHQLYFTIHICVIDVMNWFRPSILQLSSGVSFLSESLLSGTSCISVCLMDTLIPAFFYEEGQCLRQNGWLKRGLSSFLDRQQSGVGGVLSA